MTQFDFYSVAQPHGKCNEENAGPFRPLTNPEVISQANLKETSLYGLALRCGIGDARAFVQRFIDYEREVCRK